VKVSREHGSFPVSTAGGATQVTSPAGVWSVIVRNLGWLIKPAAAFITPKAASACRSSAATSLCDFRASTALMVVYQ
jgi:hypothetical protein